MDLSFDAFQGVMQLFNACESQQTKFIFKKKFANNNHMGFV